MLFGRRMREVDGEESAINRTVLDDSDDPLKPCIFIELAGHRVRQ